MKYAGQSKAAAIQKGSFCILIVFRFLFIGHLSIEHPQSPEVCTEHLGAAL